MSNQTFTVNLAPLWPRFSFLCLWAVVLPACVTVNIYFPEAAAEKAADRIIDEVWGKKPRARQAPAKEPISSLPVYLAKLLHDGLYGLTAPAHARQADINVSSPVIEKIKARMQSRHGKLKPYFDSGAVGLTRHALVQARRLGTVPLKSRNALKKLVAAENRDRDALYREIAEVNGQPQWEKQIRNTFASRWIAKASAGWWYQDESGAWKQR